MNVSMGSKVAINPETGKKDKNGVHVTKQGNPYYKTNMCKKVATGVTVASSLIGVAGYAAMTKDFKGAAKLFGLALGAYLPSALIGGAVGDALINHHEKKKADAMAPYMA